MLDLSAVKARYFKVKIGGQVLDLEPPRLKMLKKMFELSTRLTRTAEDGAEAGGDDFDVELFEELVGSIAGLLSKNKAKKKIAVEFVEENFGFDEMTVLLEKYFDWIAEMQKDPN